MQPFQVPRPAGGVVPNRRPGPPGPGRPIPGQPAARPGLPGLPKPKNPALIGGKPLMPISSLIQATPYTDPEENNTVKESTENGLAIPEQSQGETLTSEKKLSDIVNTQEQVEKLELHKRREEKPKQDQAYDEIDVDSHPVDLSTKQYYPIFDNY